jgi:DNA-binding SARP family transcriptional activator
LPFRQATELVVRLEDRDLATELIDVCGDAVRTVLRELAAAPELARPARRLLREIPAAPLAEVRVGTLGPMTLHHGDVASEGGDWRRERVRSLLAYLITFRNATRAAIADALWPALDADAGAANLRTTLNYLHRALEPARAAGDAPWFVRSEGERLVLHTSGLTVDAWDLESHLDAAGAADEERTPSRALEQLEAALALWHGDYLADVFDDWAGPERERLRARFLSASVRAGELLLGRGEVDRTLAIATRALDAEPWLEAAHRLVVASHLARGDRVTARRSLDRCRTALGELGIAPSQETEMLARGLAG